jgi:hypothetical protein
LNFKIAHHSASQVPFRGQIYPPALLSGTWSTRFRLFKDENLEAMPQFPATPKKKILLPEIVPLNAVDSVINLRRVSARLASRRP